MKIYVITDGAYEDYDIKAIFTDEKQAQIYCAKNEYDDIEVWEANPETFDTNIMPKKLWIGRFWTANGFEHNEIESRYTLRDVDNVAKSFGMADVVVEVSLDINVDKEEAEKIIFDKYTQWKNKQ